MMMDRWQTENYMKDIYRKNNTLEGHIRAQESFCEEVNCKARKTTNADKIRSMTDEELASLLIHSDTTEEVWYCIPYGDRFDCFESAIKNTLMWLKEEIK